MAVRRPVKPREPRKEVSISSPSPSPKEKATRALYDAVRLCANELALMIDAGFIKEPETAVRFFRECLNRKFIL